MNQLLNLSENETLSMWKRLMHIDLVLRECNLERDDGIDLDDLLVRHLRQWYAHLLMTAPLQWLPVEDVGALVQLEVSTDGVVTAIMPERCVRLVEWQLAGWQRSVTTFAQPDDEFARRQHSIWLRGGNENPVIVQYNDRLMLYSVEPGTLPVLLKARCVTVPENNRYVFHHDALSSLPKWEESLMAEC